MRATRFILAAVAFIAVLSLMSCKAMNTTTGIENNRLAPCPSSPNCVSSDATDEGHAVEPFGLAADPDQAWAALQEVMKSRPRTRIVELTGDYLHAEEKSRLFGFVDDIEFHLRPGQGLIAVRSASRTGYSDLGVNRRRVEAIRQALKDRGVVE